LIAFIEVISFAYLDKFNIHPFFKCERQESSINHSTKKTKDPYIKVSIKEPRVGEQTASELLYALSGADPK